MMKLTRWGNSLGLRLPCEMAQAAGLNAGDYVQVRLLDSGDIRVRPFKAAQPAYPESGDGTGTATVPAGETKW